MSKKNETKTLKRPAVSSSVLMKYINMTEEEKTNRTLLVDRKLKDKISDDFHYGLYNCYYELILCDFDVDKTYDKIINYLENRPKY